LVAQNGAAGLGRDTRGDFPSPSGEATEDATAHAGGLKWSARHFSDVEVEEVAVGHGDYEKSTAENSATQAAGLQGFRIHDLRHTAASLILESGATVVDVAAVVGHASSHTTLSVYAHLIGRRLDHVVDRLSKQIESSCGQNVATPPNESSRIDVTWRGNSR
jgi:hypothetical protein